MTDQARRLRLATDAEKLRRETIRRQRDEVALAKETGEVIDRRSIELFASIFLTDFGDWCDQLPDVVAVKSGIPAKHRTAVKKTLLSELDQRRIAMAATLEAKSREVDAQLRDTGD